MSKRFDHDARDFKIGDAVLVAAVGKIERGLASAVLGGHLIKQRVARAGEGESGGYRTVLIFREGDRAVFVYVFPKNTKSNLRPEEMKAWREHAKRVLAFSEDEMSTAVVGGQFREILRTED